MTGRADLRGLSDNDLLTRLRALPRASGQRAAICEILVERYTHLVRACVRPYRQSPEPVEDLMQAGYVGLLKAINNFDPAAGDSLSAYAAPCISGEVKRYFRDKRWQVHVRRPVQELLLEMHTTTADLAQQLGRPRHRHGRRPGPPGRAARTSASASPRCTYPGCSPAPWPTSATSSPATPETTRCGPGLGSV
jgi:Sigma-70 region 2